MGVMIHTLQHNTKLGNCVEFLPCPDYSVEMQVFGVGKISFSWGAELHVGGIYVLYLGQIVDFSVMQAIKLERLCCVAALQC